MLTSLSSNAISAKARAIYGKRLTNANYHDLLRMTTVSDVCAYLKTNTSYSSYLKGINEASVHRGQLESLLIRSRIEKYFDLLHYDFTSQKGFYRYVVANAEVNIILHAIMMINSASISDMITSIPSFLQEYTHIDFKAISTVETFDELLTALENTPYKNVIKRFNAPQGSINYKECELALKTFYYQTIFDQIDKYYKGETKKELIEIVKIEVELLNLGLIYRLSRYFKKSPEEIKSQLLPFHYKLSKKALDNLLMPQHKVEFIKNMRLPSYNSSMRDVEFNYIEDYTKRLKYIISRKMMRFSSNAPISFYSLMTLLQIEVDNIIIIIESVRYNNNDTETQKLLVLE